MGIHLFVPMLHRHDAVGEHTIALRDRLVLAGVDSRIYSQIPDPRTRDDTRYYLDYESDAQPGDVLVYQFATESVIATWLAGRPEPVVINYHSITPPRYFWPWSNGITRLQVGARLELDQLAPRAALGIAVSRFDEQRAGLGRMQDAPRSSPSSRSPSLRSFPTPTWSSGSGREVPEWADGGSRWVAWLPTNAIIRPSPPCSWLGQRRTPRQV